MSELSEFEWEPQPGLPAPLPPDENIIWQGSPNWLALAIDAFHVRKVAIYFGILVALDLARQLTLNSSDTEALFAGPALTLVLCLGALTLLTSLAWLSASATIYTLTNRRLLIRFGIAIQLTINLPFKQLVSADLKERANRTGNIPLQTAVGSRVSYLVMWPHVRPWHFRQPQPMLRAIPNAKQVAGLIAQAVRTNSAVGVTADTKQVQTQTAPVTSPLDTAGA